MSRYALAATRAHALDEAQDALANRASLAWYARQDLDAAEAYVHQLEHLVSTSRTERARRRWQHQLMLAYKDLQDTTNEFQSVTAQEMREREEALRRFKPPRAPPRPRTRRAPPKSRKAT